MASQTQFVSRDKTVAIYFIPVQTFYLVSGCGYIFCGACDAPYLGPGGFHAIGNKAHARDCAYLEGLPVKGHAKSALPRSVYVPSSEDQRHHYGFKLNPDKQDDDTVPGPRYGRDNTPKLKELPGMKIGWNYPMAAKSKKMRRIIPPFIIFAGKVLIST
jgi:hypothetical protein